MALDITNDIKKTRLKNTILKKGFQGNDAKPEEIARFTWLNLNHSKNISSASELYSFLTDHPFMLMLPSDESILPDMVSTINGGMVFFSEYPKLAKMFEPVLSEFTQNYLLKGLAFEYPLFQSTNVIMLRDCFMDLYRLKQNLIKIEEDTQLILDFIAVHSYTTKKMLREAFRNQPAVFSRIDFHLYQLQHAMQIYKAGFDQIEGSQFSLLDPLLSDSAKTPSNVTLNDFLSRLIKSTLYVNPVLLQRALKKHFDKSSVNIALTNLETSGVLYKVKLNRITHLVHKETFAKINILP